MKAIIAIELSHKIVNKFVRIMKHFTKSSVSRQSDGSSCGIFVAMTAYNWYQYRRLPGKNVYLNECNDGSLKLLIQDILYFITFCIPYTSRKINFTSLVPSTVRRDAGG